MRPPNLNVAVWQSIIINSISRKRFWVTAWRQNRTTSPRRRRTQTRTNLGLTFFTTTAGLWPFLLRDSIETTPLEPTAPLGAIERQSRPLRRLRKSGSILMSLSFSIPRPLSPLHKNYFYFCKPAFECRAFELNYFAFKVVQENRQQWQHSSKSTYLTSKRSWALILPGAFSLFAISSVALNRSLAEM